ncbi:MAG: hypothetical protein U1F68_21095 [Gammaproteobacteria bacterium]
MFGLKKAALPPAVETYVQARAMVRELPAQRGALETDREHAKRQLGEARDKAEQTRLAIQRFLAHHGGEATLADAGRAELQALRERQAAAARAVERAQEQIATLGRAIEKKGAEIADARAVADTTTLTLKDLQAHGKARAEARADVTRLQALIDQQRAALNQGPTEQALADARQRVQEALADAAEGKGDAAELAQREKALESTLSAAHKGSHERARAQATLAGLEPRLAAAQTRCADLEEASANVIGLYLRGELNAALSAYRRMAAQLAEFHHHAAAIAELLDQTPGFKDQIEISAQGVFDLATGSPVYDLDGARLDALIAEKRQALAKLGLAL